MLKNGSKASHYADVTVLDLGPTVFCNIVLPFIKWENLDQEIIRPFLSAQLEFLVIQHFWKASQIRHLVSEAISIADF